MEGMGVPEIKYGKKLAMAAMMLIIQFFEAETTGDFLRRAKELKGSKLL